MKTNKSSIKTKALDEKEKNAVLILAAGYKAYDNSFISHEPFLNIGNTLIIERIKKK